MGASWDSAVLGEVSFVTDFSANGSFADLRENVEYLSQPDYAVLVRLLDFSRNWDGDFVYIPKRSWDFLRKCQLEVGDVIIANIGANAGTLFKVPDLGKPSALGPNALVIKTDKFPNTSKEFLYYYFKSPDGQNQIQSIITGSAQPKFTKTDLRNLKIPFPEPSEQRAIAGILGALDDKIELNRRMNRTLESMARAVFRQWFVDNEDVGGWEVKSIGEIAERVGMGPFGSSIKVDTFVDEGIPVINGQQLRGFMLEDSGFNFISLEHAEKLKNANVYPGDIVITHRGTLGQVSLIPYDAKHKRYIVSQSQFFVRCNSEMITPNFLIYYLSSPEGQYKLLANRSAVGVPAIAQPVTYLRSIEIAVPPKEILDTFEKIIAPMHSKYSANRRESRTLASLRDSLLPKLMRGEVRVKDVGA